MVGGEADGCMPHRLSTGGNTNGPPGIVIGFARGTTAGGGLYNHGCLPSALDLFARNEVGLLASPYVAPIDAKWAPWPRHSKCHATEAQRHFIQAERGSIPALQQQGNCL